MSYKSVELGYTVDGEDMEVFLVVPQEVDTATIMAATMGNGEPYDVICEAFSMEGASLIARLLNEYEMAGHC